jgi:putative membrane protein
MFISLIIAILIGIIAGTITGLTPGLHINLVNVFIIASVPLLPEQTPLMLLCTTILAMSITHTFVDSVPSIYLGAPDPDHALSALPGHRLLLEGKGHLAIFATIVGSLGALITCTLLLPIFILLMKIIAEHITPYIGYIIILIIFSMTKNLTEAGIFLLAGALGTTVFIMPGLTQPLFPLLSGLFGLSILLPSLTTKSSLPPQKNTNNAIKKPAKGIIISSIMGFIAGFFPGLGSSQVAIIGSKFIKDSNPEQFLILTGGINTANMLVSLATAYALGKARNGSIVSIMQLVPDITLQTLIVFSLTALIAGCLAVWITFAMSKAMQKILAVVPYRLITAFIIILIAAAVFLFDAWAGLFILIAATSLGLYAAHTNTSKHFLMGCLLLPVIIYFL